MAVFTRLSGIEEFDAKLLRLFLVENVGEGHAYAS